MNQTIGLGGGDTAPVLALSHPVAVYDPTDGRIVHLHHVLVLEGGRRVERAEAEAAAGKLAGKAGHDIERLRVQYLDSPLPEDRRSLRIDTATGRLISE